MLDYWRQLGYTQSASGQLSATAAEALYGHHSGLESLLLEHNGCKVANGGYVRLMVWDRLYNVGAGATRPLTPGSGWMGIYTRDILSVHDAYTDSATHGDQPWWISNVVRAPLQWPPPHSDFFTPFVGLREMLALTDFARHAFIQRAGFDRPGFGTFDTSLPYQNTEGTHANIVQPVGSFNSSFYKSVLGWETAPFGDAEDIGDKPATAEVLAVAPGQMARMERLKSPHSPTGMLQVYSPHTSPHPPVDCRPGSLGLSMYSVATAELEALCERADRHGASWNSDIAVDEFGRDCCVFTAPDGFSWSAIRHV